MKSVVCIKKLLLVGIFLQVGYSFASQEPQGLWEKFKAALGWQWLQKTQEAQKQEEEDKSLMEIEAEAAPFPIVSEEAKPNIITENVLKPSMRVPKKLIGGLIVSSFGSMGWFMLEVLMGSRYPQGLAFYMMTSVALMEVVGLDMLMESLERGDITKSQAIVAAKENYKIAFSILDTYPTTQMKLNEIGRLIVLLKRQERSSSVDIQIAALQSLKNDLEDSPVLKMIRELQSDYPVGGDIQKLASALDSEQDNVIKAAALREMLINEYIRRLSNNWEETVGNQQLWRALKDELAILTKAQNEDCMSKKDRAQLEELRSNYEYTAFKSVLTAINQDVPLLFILYGHEYKKVKENTPALKSWLLNIQNDSYYNKDIVEQARINVDKKDLQQQLLKSKEDDKIAQLKRWMEKMQQGDADYKAANILLQELEAK